MGKELAGREQEACIESLFSSIVQRYDLLNTVMSLGRHGSWRRCAVSESRLSQGGVALDVCCGTGDMAVELARKAGPMGRVVGVDFSRPMLALAGRKVRQRAPGVRLLAANATHLPFADGVFDCATIAFGLRNVVDARQAVSEMARVVRPGGRVVCLEILGIESGPLVTLWRGVFRLLAPAAARLMGSSRQAYEYLPKSVERFLSREEMSQLFRDCGLADVRWRDRMFGSVTIHVAVRPEP